MTRTDERPLALMLICGEPSGDRLGAELMAGIRALSEDKIDFTGVGGPAMAAQGLRSLFPLDATAVMGLREVLPRLPQILKRVRVAADFALTSKPDAVVCIDSPDFTHRIAKRLRRLNPDIPAVDYVAPQVWATRPYRARTMAKYFDLVLALLPFEAEFFEAQGLPARFVGHPVVERAGQISGGAGLRQRLSIPAGAPLLAILPGSRISEVRLLLPVFRKTAEAVQARIPELHCILPAVPHIASAVRDLTDAWPGPLHIAENEAGKFAAFDASDAALAASGTVTTELALAGVPMAVAYRLDWLTYRLVRPFVRVPYISLVNLLLNREAVPEYIQERCRPDLLAACVLRLLRDSGYRARQQKDLREAVHLLGADGEAPSLRAARALLDFVRKRRQRRSIGT